MLPSSQNSGSRIDALNIVSRFVTIPSTHVLSMGTFPGTRTFWHRIIYAYKNYNFRSSYPYLLLIPQCAG